MGASMEAATSGPAQTPRWPATVRALQAPLAAVLLALGVSGCGEPVLVGSFCRDGALNCSPSRLIDPVISFFPGSACEPIVTSRHPVRPEQQTVELCELATITPARLPREPVLYVAGWVVESRIWSGASEEGQRGEQLVVVRRSAASAALDGLPDGPVDCEAAMLSGDFTPFLSAQDSERDQAYGDAGIPVAPGDRLLIVQRHLNRLGEAVEIGLELDLDCRERLAGAFLQPFEFTVGEPTQRLLQPGPIELSGSCAVRDRDIELLRLSGEPVAVGTGVSLTARVSLAGGPEQVLSSDGIGSVVGAPQRLSVGDELRLKCLFQRGGDLPVPVGSAVLPACHVSGLYQLTDGAFDLAPPLCRN